MMFMGILGMMMFFMLSGAFRAAGDAQTPLRLGIGMTVLTIIFNVVLIRMFGTVGAAFGTIASSTTVSLYGMWFLTRPGSVIHFERGMDLKPDFTIIRSLFRFGLPTGVQGIAMNVGGVFMLRYIGSLEHSAAAQAAFAVGLHRALLAHHLDVERADGRVGDDRRPEPRRRQSRSRGRRRACRRADRPRRGAGHRRALLADSRLPARRVRHDRPAGGVARRPTCCGSSACRACS